MYAKPQVVSPHFRSMSSLKTTERTMEVIPRDLGKGKLGNGSSTRAQKLKLINHKIELYSKRVQAASSRIGQRTNNQLDFYESEMEQLSSNAETMRKKIEEIEAEQGKFDEVLKQVVDPVNSAFTKFRESYLNAIDTQNSLVQGLSTKIDALNNEYHSNTDFIQKVDELKAITDRAGDQLVDSMSKIGDMQLRTSNEFDATKRRVLKKVAALQEEIMNRCDQWQEEAVNIITDSNDYCTTARNDQFRMRQKYEDDLRVQEDEIQSRISATRNALEELQDYHYESLSKLRARVNQSHKKLMELRNTMKATEPVDFSKDIDTLRAIAKRMKDGIPTVRVYSNVSGDGSIHLITLLCDGSFILGDCKK